MNALRMKAARPAYVVFAVIFGLLEAFGAFVLFRKPQVENGAFLVVIPIIGLVAVWFWLSRFELSILDGALFYRAPLRKPVRLPLSDIRRKSLQVGMGRVRDYRPILRLDTLCEGKERTLYINVKLYRLDQVGQLLTILGVDSTKWDE